MKRLPQPLIDDEAIARGMAENNRLSSHPFLSDNLNAVLMQYVHYNLRGGAANLLPAPLGLPDALAAALRTHYSGSVKGLEFIEEIRTSSSPDVCPMCGGFHPTQVDHVIPKENYPEFSFFSKNLVPACSCNTKKGQKFKGNKEGERVLHPYYDEVLTQRLAYISLSGDLNSPLLQVALLPNHRENPAVAYHVDCIVRGTNILHWARAKWANLLRTPKSVLPALRYLKVPWTVEILREVVRGMIMAKDEEFGTPNNWESILLEGFLHRDDVFSFILKKVEDNMTNAAALL